jgi:hypothetical protein
MRIVERINLARLRALYLEWQRYAWEGVATPLAEAASHRFKCAEAETIARCNQTAVGRRLLPSVAKCSEPVKFAPATPRKPRPKFSGDRPEEAYFRTPDGKTMRRVVGVTRVGGAHVVRMKTRFGEFRAPLPVMDWDQLAFELDVARLTLLHAGFFGSRHAIKRRHHFKPKWNYPEFAKKWLAGEIAPPLCSELAEPLERWMEYKNAKILFEFGH